MTFSNTRTSIWLNNFISDGRLKRKFIYKLSLSASRLKMIKQQIDLVSLAVSYSAAFPMDYAERTGRLISGINMNYLRNFQIRGHQYCLIISSQMAG